MKIIHIKASVLSVLVCLSYSTNILSVGVNELAHFAREFWHHPAQVGALMPCMPAVGKELTKYIVKFQREHPRDALHLLEVGAGTGPITAVLATLLRPGLDTLDAVEISSDFCKELHKKFDEAEYTNINIRCVSILDWTPEYKYDFIISTLPFNSFSFDLMSGIIDHLKALIKPNGILSYVAYAGVARAKKPFLWGKNKREHIAKMDVLQKFRTKYEIDENLILINFPPIHVYHLRIR